MSKRPWRPGRRQRENLQWWQWKSCKQLTEFRPIMAEIVPGACFHKSLEISRDRHRSTPINLSLSICQTLWRLSKVYWSPSLAIAQQLQTTGAGEKIANARKTASFDKFRPLWAPKMLGVVTTVESTMVASVI